MTGVRGSLLGTAIAVRDLDGAVADHEQRGFVLSDRSYRTEWGIEVATFGFADGSYLELVTPKGGAHEIAQAMAAFLDQYGDATYLTCIEVEDIAAAYDHLLTQGIDALGPPQSAPPSTGELARMVWLKPRSFGGAFIQLLELQDGPRRFARVTPGRRLVGKALVVDGEDALRSSLGQLGAVPESVDGRERLTFGNGTFIELVAAERGFGVVTAPDDARLDDQHQPGEAAP